MHILPLPYCKSDLPEGVSGDWVLERFEIPAPRAVDPPLDTRPDWARTPPGWYTRLRRGHETFMTDMLDEWWMQSQAMDEAQRRGGHVLITGLGLGMIVEAILGQPDSLVQCIPSVQCITVVEHSDDVIRLVAPHLLARYPERLEIVQGDAFTWTPPAGVRYSVVWHDIWPNPRDPACADDMQRLHARFAACCDWQGSWTVPD